MVPAITPNKEQSISRDAWLPTATDLADYAVRKGIPFRDAHEIVGKAVAYGIAQNKDLSELSPKSYSSFPVLSSKMFSMCLLWKVPSMHAIISAELLLLKSRQQFNAHVV